jgi:hypothetical protein
MSRQISSEAIPKLMEIPLHSIFLSNNGEGVLLDIQGISQ